MVNEKYINSIVDYIILNDVDVNNSFVIYNKWSRENNIIIKDSKDVQFLVEMINDFKQIKQTDLIKLLKRGT